jgi:hypothetical protein
MPISLFNPPCPHADPVVGWWDQQSGARCGNCVCVPRYWALDVPYSGSDPYARLFAGRHVLTRTLKSFESDFLSGTCQWAASIDLRSVAGPGFIGTIVLSETVISATGASAGIEDWYVIMSGLPAIGAAPPDVAVWWMHGSIPALGNYPDTRPFRCLSPNTFYPRQDAGSGGFLAAELPAKITLEPFWL